MTPIMVGSAMAFAASSGLGTLKELFASAKTYVNGLEAYPDNEIIQGVLPHIEYRKQAKEQTKALRENAIARLKQNDCRQCSQGRPRGWIPGVRRNAVK